jgi:hypothetical protein
MNLPLKNKLTVKSSYNQLLRATVLQENARYNTLLSYRESPIARTILYRFNTTVYFGTRISSARQ